ncbi:MAG: hypothetical protein MJK18_13940, partial [Bdellovibrionales bacterium]|nr:hypothetical protein [Bdellovibrionales bacterium]
LEVFGDWFSTEVVAQSTYLDQNMRTDLCERRELKKGSSYISNQDRLNRIYFAQPQIQKKLGVKSQASYCSLTSATK